MRITDPTLIACTPSERENVGALKPAPLPVSYSASMPTLSVTVALVEDSAENLSICAFDLETERFSIFSAPAIDGITEERHAIDFRFNVLRGCLCLSYTLDDKVVIWMMKEYRAVESWTMLHHIGIAIDCGIDDCHWKVMNVYPIKLFENGDVMMFLEEKCLIYYSNETRTLRQVCRLTEGTSEDDEACAMIYTPSLFSLKSFGVENVISF